MDQPTNRLHTDAVFAPLDRDNDMERIAGGNETEVYRTDDWHYVVKVKSDAGGKIPEVLENARAMRQAAERFADCLGPQHAIHTHYLITRDSAGEVQPVAVQPFLVHARPLHDIAYNTLSQRERNHIARELRDVVRRALSFYRTTGEMPDLYGRSSRNQAERQRLNRPWMLPWRIWGFLVRRTLLRSNNLILTSEPQPRLILIDYDTVRRGWLYRRTYFAVRWFLFIRDHLLILWMQWGGTVAAGRG